MIASKTGDNQFYERIVTVADDSYDEHLEPLLAATRVSRSR